MRAKPAIFLFVFIVFTLAVFPIEAFKVTGVSVSVSEREYKGFCPHKFVFTGRITANREGTVRYTWLRSEAIPRKTYTLVFAAAGTQTVTHEWELGGVMGKFEDRWAQIEILEPNSRKSNQAEFDLECIPKVVMERKLYRITGTLVASVSSTMQKEWLEGLQLKVNLTDGTRLVKSQTINVNGDAIAYYSFVLINSPGRYCVNVEPIHPTAPEKFFVCYERTEPASVCFDLTEASPDHHQIFRLIWGWRHHDSDDEPWASPCW